MDIAIIGAGISGLAAGHALRRAGHTVKIYEASSHAGGRAMLHNRPGTQDWADVGSQYYHSNYKLGLKLIDEVGLTPKLKKIKGSTRMFTGRDRDSYKLSPRLPWLKPGGLVGNFKVAMYMAHLLLKHQSGTFAATPEQKPYDDQVALESTSNMFVRNHFVRMLSLIGGLSEPDYANVNLLQIYRLAKIIMLTDYISLKGGTATLHTALAQQSDIRLNSPVAALIETDNRVTGIRLESGEIVHVDHVIVAAHAPGAAKLLPGTWTLEHDFLSGIKMPPMFIVSFFLDHTLEKDVWTHFLPFEHKGPVSFCVDAQQKSPGNHPSGKATLQAWIIHPKAAALPDMTDDELAAAALKDISPFIPGVDGHVEGFAVMRHIAAVPQSTVGHNAAALAFLERVDQRLGVSFCGDYFSGGYIESALWSVERTVERLLANQDVAGLKSGFIA